MIKLNVKEKLNKEGIEKILQDETLSKSKKMIKLFEGGLDVKTISELMNVRYNFVYNVVNNYLIKEGLHDKIIKEKRASKKDDVIRLWLDGLSVIDIAKKLKTNYNYVWKICNECMQNEELRKEFEKRRKEQNKKK